MKGFTDFDVPDQSGRTFFVTGANAGLGFETSRVLAKRGARVLMGCRSEDKARTAIARIHAELPKADLEWIPLDQASLISVRKAAQRVKRERLDVLVNNAGIMIPPRELTRDGFESQFGVNHLGTFALTGLLLDKLRARTGSRVVVTSSLAHRRAQIDFDDINAERGYAPMKRYQMSKLANLAFTYELDRRLRAKGATTIAVGCHPGIAETELQRHTPRWATGLLSLANPLFNSAASGAWPTLMAATSPDVEGGQYFGPGRLGIAGPARRVKSSAESKDADLGRRLWDLSVEMTGIDPDI